MTLNGEIITLFILFRFCRMISLNPHTRISVWSDYNWPAQGPIQKKIICRTLTLRLDFKSEAYMGISEGNKHIFTLGV